MADFSFANIEDFVKEHPYATAAIGIGTVLILWWALSPSATPAAAPAAAPNDNASIAAAAQISAAQIAANQQTTAESIAAGVANEQTAATEAAHITDSNNQEALGALQANDALAAASSTSFASEINSAAQALAMFGSTITNYQGPNLTALGMQDALAQSEIGTNYNLNLNQNENAANVASIQLAGGSGGSSNVTAGENTIASLGANDQAAQTKQFATTLDPSTFLQTSTATALSGDQFNQAYEHLLSTIGEHT